MEVNWKDELKERKQQKQLIYHSPLPRKTQRVTLKYQKSGKCKVYSEEQIYLHKLREYSSSFDN